MPEINPVDQNGTITLIKEPKYLSIISAGELRWVLSPNVNDNVNGYSIGPALGNQPIGTIICGTDWLYLGFREGTFISPEGSMLSNISIELQDFLCSNNDPNNRGTINLVDHLGNVGSDHSKLIGIDNEGSFIFTGDKSFWGIPNLDINKTWGIAIHADVNTIVPTMASLRNAVVTATFSLLVN